MLNTVNIPRLDQLAPLLTSVGAAASAMGRLDQALGSHPLAQAWLHRMRLEAVRRQAAVDGDLIDQWHLAATLEGLRLRMDPYLRIIDRAVILDKAKVALGYHQWLVEPDFDQEGEVQRAAFGNGSRVAVVGRRCERPPCAFGVSAASCAKLCRSPARRHSLLTAPGTGEAGCRPT
jgi:hypothetical protein